MMFLSCSSPTNNSEINGKDGRQTGDTGGKVTVICECYTDSKYVSGTGGTLLQAEQQAQNKCQKLSSSVKNCELTK